MPLRPRNGLPIAWEMELRPRNELLITLKMELRPHNGLPIAWEMELCPRNGLPITWEMELRSRNRLPIAWEVFLLYATAFPTFFKLSSRSANILYSMKKPSNPQVAVGRSHRRGLRRIVDIHFVAYKLLQASLRSDPQLCTGDLSEALFMKKPQVRGPRALFTNKT